MATIGGEKGFLFLKPNIVTNADRIARAIAMCKGVKEVFLTSGKYGYVVTVNTWKGGSIKQIKKSVKKISKIGEISVAVNHYLYKNKRVVNL